MDDRQLAHQKIGLEITDQISAMLAYWDKDQVCRFANNAYMHWFGKRKEDMMDKITMKELLGPLYEKNLPHIKAALAGELQVFEREISLPTGGSKHSLATYIPDVSDGEVKGFFVHVADVTYIKELEKKLEEGRREQLRMIIETQESERKAIADALRDSINQTLTYCRLILSHKITSQYEYYQGRLSQFIQKAIEELATISTNLVPSDMQVLGLVGGIENYVEDCRKTFGLDIQFINANGNIETIKEQDKMAVFRMVQNFLRVAVHCKKCKNIIVKTFYEPPLLKLTLAHDGESFELLTESSEYKNIALRVAYYDGRIHQVNSNELEVRLFLEVA